MRLKAKCTNYRSKKEEKCKKKSTDLGQLRHDDRNFVITVSGCLWYITFVSRKQMQRLWKHDEELYGFCDPATHCLYIQNRMGRIATMETLFHELVHIPNRVTTAATLKVHDEVIAESLSLFLIEIIPQLPAWVLAELILIRAEYVSHIKANKR